MSAKRKRWLDSGDPAELANAQAGYWHEMSDAVRNGTFWADRIPALRGDPRRRLALAMENLPLPAAFHEGCVATRALIRAVGAESTEGRELLKLLYWLAAIESFMLDYAPVVGEPGFNVMESTPGKRICALQFTFAELGVDRLRLLNKNDKKWLVAAFGAPRSNRTLNELRREIWEEFEHALAMKRRRSDETFVAEIQDIVRAAPRPWWKFWG